MRSQCGNLQNICKFLHMRHNFRMGDFENAICEKICDMWVLAKICDRIFAYNRYP